MPHLDAVISPLVSALTRDANRVVVQEVDGRSWTGAELSARLSQFVQVFEARKLASGARVAVLCGNSTETLLLHLAVKLTASCLVPLHPMGSAADHGFAIENGGVDHLIFDPAKFEPLVAELKAGTPRLKQVMGLGPNQVGLDLLAEADACAPGPLGARRVDAETMVRLSFSGGTTGTPKAIVIPQRVADEVEHIMLTEWEWPDSPRMLVVVPLSHAGGTLFAPVLFKQGTVFVMPGFDAGNVLAAIERHRINCIMMVPTMIYALLDHPDFETRDLSSLKTIFYGASLMSPVRLKEGIERMGKIFFQFYGQAEAPMSVMTLRKAEHDPEDPRRLASCGRPVPWVDMQLLDDGDQPVAPGEHGEICVRGPLVMTEYLGREDLTASAFSGGWLHTGDVAVRDPDGFYRIVDRKKDMIVTGGFNVFPSEVEHVLAQHPSVAQVCVYATPDDKWGEAVTATIVLRAGAATQKEELIELVRQQKGPVQAPKRVYFVDAIPQTAVGKPDKRALQRLHSASV